MSGLALVRILDELQRSVCKKGGAFSRHVDQELPLAISTGSQAVDVVFSSDPIMTVMVLTDSVRFDASAACRTYKAPSSHCPVVRGPAEVAPHIVISYPKAQRR